MTKSTVAGYITITFDDQDFRRRGGGAMQMIGLMKERIPPNERAYDPNTKVWTVLDTKDNQDKVRQAYLDAFTDPAQGILPFENTKE